MRICLFTNGSGGGGTERILSLLANNLSVRGHQVVCLCVVASSSGSYIQDKKIKFYCLSNYQQLQCSRFVRIIKVIKLIRNFFLANTFDIVVVMDAPSCVKFFLATLGIHLHEKILMSERNDPNRYWSDFVRKTFRKIAYLSADKLIFQTYDAMKCFSKKNSK